MSAREPLERRIPPDAIQLMSRGSVRQRNLAAQGPFGVQHGMRAARDCHVENIVRSPSSRYLINPPNTFVTRQGTDFKFVDSDRVESEALLPGGQSKYKLTPGDDESSASDTEEGVICIDGTLY